MTFKVFDLLPLMNDMDKLQFFKYPQHVDNSVKKWHHMVSTTIRTNTSRINTCAGSLVSITVGSM